MIRSVTRRAVAVAVMMVPLGCDATRPDGNARSHRSSEPSSRISPVGPGPQAPALLVQPMPGPSSPAPFAVRDRDAAAFFADTGFTIALAGWPRSVTDPSSCAGWPMRWVLAGARSAPPEPTSPLSARVYHLVGAPSQWITDLPT